MACGTVRGGLLARLGPQGVAWLLALAVGAAWFGYHVGVGDRDAAVGGQAAGE